jgi:hypothetical protein
MGRGLQGVTRYCYYLQPGKRKARKMLKIWVSGATALGRPTIVSDHGSIMRKGYTPVFYGVAPTTVASFNAAARQGKPWVYIDNQYFPTAVGRMYRATWSALQHTGEGTSNGQRLRTQFKNGKIPLKPWRTGGGHILITMQSDLYFNLLMPYTRNQWLQRVMKTIKKHTDRPIIVREKPHPSRPYAQRVSFEEHLKNCHAVVTLSSATATEAIMQGIPGIATDPHCALAPASLGGLSQIEDPPQFDRLAWLEVLADHHWTASEFNMGMPQGYLESTYKVDSAPSDIVQRSYKLGDIA